MAGRSTSKRWVPVAVAMAALLGLPAAPGTSAPERRSAAGERPATGELPSQVIVQRAIVRPLGFALDPAGGAFYVSETGPDRLWRVTFDGTREELPADIVPSGGLGPGSDGSLLIASGTGVTTLAADGTTSVVDVPGATGIDAVGSDATGTVYATDSEAGRVVQIDPDGTVSDLAFTTTSQPRWIDVADDGTVSVIDGATGDIVRRAPDGTETVLTLNVDLPVTFDIDGDQVMVGAASDGTAPARAALQLGDGSVRTLGDVGAPGQVLSAPEGRFFTDTGLTGCRCPEPAGAAYEMDGEDPFPLPIGDVADITSVGANGPGTALFASWSGPQGYSDPNPLRQASLAGASTDVALPGWTVASVDAAPDGTAYITAWRPNEAPTVHLLRRTSSGDVTEIPLPTGPADQLTTVSVDTDGRVFAAFSYGYGTGPFRIARWTGEGWDTWYAAPDDFTGSLEAMAAGGGRVLIVSTDSGPGQPALREVGEDGTLTTVRELPAGAFSGMDVDVDGNVYLIATSGVKAVDPTPISVIAADGQTGTITYAGIEMPRALSIGSDGTLYVADAELGLVAIPDVGPVAGDPGPTTPPPAVPVQGNANFTG